LAFKPLFSLDSWQIFTIEIKKAIKSNPIIPEIIKKFEEVMIDFLDFLDA
jgi:hypothetical protein